MKRFKVQAGDMGPPPPPGRASYMYEKAKQAPLLNCILKITPCLCFLEQFELLVSSFSAVS